MRTICGGLAALFLIFAATPAAAGLWDDVKAAVSDASDAVDDVKSTRDEASDTVDDAKDIVGDTSDDVESVIPERKKKSPPPSAGPAPPPPPSATPPPPPPSARKWHVDTGDGQTREVSEAELAKLIRGGSVGRDTYVYGASLGEWTAAGEVAALKRYFAK